MTDRELLKLAAKAASIILMRWNDGREPYSSGEGFILENDKLWNPLTSDGDAQRLAVVCRISVSQSVPEEQVDESYSWARYKDIEYDEGLENGDLFAATRRAIVLVAARIGEEME